ncbi:hypothetical protein GH714_000774 [Hevea brasiliensis]|uniref:Reverse transcriptase domain-containing protein n=1 Tax=Hevea brasiliensis TaxID=3981 RepID=A0A6A6L5G4_HEVBR|nr:hypothetical protein GH714_000774 [Hevea brasiliensis]
MLGACLFYYTRSVSCGVRSDNVEIQWQQWISTCAKKLSQWSRTAFRNVTAEIHRVQKKLNNLSSSGSDFGGQRRVLRVQASDLSFVQRRVDRDMNDMLVRTFYREEIVVAVKQMHPSKAPGVKARGSTVPKSISLCSKWLVGLIDEAVWDNMLQGARIDRGPPIISHLTFANDYILFLRAKPKEAGCISSVLQRYQLLSRLAHFVPSLKLLFISFEMSVDPIEINFVLKMKGGIVRRRAIGRANAMSYEYSASVVGEAAIGRLYHHSSPLVRWSPRLSGVVKLNVDVGILGDGKIGYKNLIVKIIFVSCKMGFLWRCFRNGIS